MTSARASRRRRAAIVPGPLGNCLVLGAPGDPDPMGHNYQKRLARLWQDGRLPTTGRIVHLDICHDDGCPRLRNERCNCRPELRVRYASEVPA